MKKTVSPEAKGQLMDILTEEITKPRKWPHDINQIAFEMASRICQWYEAQNTFSDNVMGTGEKEAGEQTFHEIEPVDEKPLKKSALVIFKWLVEHPNEWFTPWELSSHLKVNEVTVTNRIRDFRTVQWGSHDTPKRRRAGTRHWEYTLIPNKESTNYQSIISQL